MHDDSKRLGGYLRQVRENLHYTLRDVEDSTSIRHVHLEAIEQGNEHFELAPAYIQGFIRQYAQFLGLDSETLIQEYPGAFRSFCERHEFAYGIGTLEMRSASHGGIKWLPNLIWALIIGGGIATLFYFMKILGLY